MMKLLPPFFIKSVFVVLLMLSLFGENVLAQKVKYTPDFKFQDGIFLNFDQVRENKPVPKSRILATIDYNDRLFFDEITSAPEIVYFDDIGNNRRVATKQIWGYSKNGILYIQLGSGFNRITIMGSICHFVANIITYSQRYYNSMPYYGYGFSPMMHAMYPSMQQQYRSSEMRQFMLDFDSGKVYEYEADNLKLILMSDPELHDEFALLKAKKQRQMQFSFVRRYNERHPLYIGN